MEAKAESELTDALMDDHISPSHALIKASLNNLSSYRPNLVISISMQGKFVVRDCFYQRIAI